MQNILQYRESVISVLYDFSPLYGMKCTTRREYKMIRMRLLYILQTGMTIEYGEDVA